MVTRRRGAAAGLLGLLLLAAGLWVLTRGRGPQQVVATAPSPIITPLLPTPGTVPAGYRVKSTDLGIDLPIVAGDGWTVPYYKAAVYPGMKMPGTGDRTMLYAHAQAGMFGPLSHAATGQHIDITRPGQPTLHYVITRYFPKWSPADLTYTKPLGHDELVLLTCTSYQANDPRILAVAEPA